MKKLFMLLLVAFATLCCVSCSDDDDNKRNSFKSGIIKMVTAGDINDLYAYTHYEGEIIEIEWGDGRSSSYNTVCAEDDEWGIIYDSGEIEHSYPEDGEYTITMKGDIKILLCDDYSIKFVDVSQCPDLNVLWFEYCDVDSLHITGCTALRELKCNGNLTTLDLDGCSSLGYLDCSDNNLISLSLHKNNSLQYIDISYNELNANALNKIFEDLPQGNKSTIKIYGNPGTETCNKSIAENKGWSVY